MQTDNESGININQTKWVLNTEAGNIGIEASKYTGRNIRKNTRNNNNTNNNRRNILFTCINSRQCRK